MAFLTQGGSQVGSSQITDGAIVNADINAAAAIAQSKIAGIANADTDIVSVEMGTSSPYSLTTLANQKVVVIAKFWLSGGGGETSASLQYNGVTKDTTDCMNNTASESNILMYTETPGAATADITIVPAVGTLNAVKILVFKFKG